MATINPYEQGGITGATRKAIFDQLTGEEQPADTAPVTVPGVQAETPATPVADYTKLGKYANYGAYGGKTDTGASKFDQPWDQRSEKYQIGTVLSNFDPNAGITPEVIAALNGANIHGAKFSGSGDKLTVDNAGGYDRFGSGGTADIIQGFKNPNQDHGWGAWFVDDQGQPQQAQGRAGGVPAMSGLNPLLSSGNAAAQIQAELQALINGSQSPYLRQAILQAMG